MTLSKQALQRCQWALAEGKKVLQKTALTNRIIVKLSDRKYCHFLSKEQKEKAVYISE